MLRIVYVFKCLYFIFEVVHDHPRYVLIDILPEDIMVDHVPLAKNLLSLLTDTRT